MSHDDHDTDEQTAVTLRPSSLTIATGGAPKGGLAARPSAHQAAHPSTVPMVPLSDSAIHAACEDIRLVSASFPGDTESWAKIIKSHLLQQKP
jgi:hypothetical protein